MYAGYSIIPNRKSDIRSLCRGVAVVFALTLLLTSALIPGSKAALPASNTYYVDASGGNDTGDGLSPQSAWNTVSKVNSQALRPGDSVLFHRGQVWREELIPPASGNASLPITFGAYSIGSRPVISGADTVSGWSQTSPNRWSTQLTQVTPPQFVFEGQVSLPRRVQSIQELTNYGDWYFDPSSLRLHMYKTQPPNQIEVTVRDRCVGVYSRSYIVLSDLSLSRTNRHAILFATCSNVLIRNCDWSWHYEQGTEFYNPQGGNTHHITFDGIAASYCGGSGINISQGGGYTADVAIRNCEAFHACMLTGSNGYHRDTAGIKAHAANDPRAGTLVIENNYSHDNGTSVASSSIAGAGIWVDEWADGGAVVRYNRSANNAYHGILIEHCNRQQIYYNVSWRNALQHPNQRLAGISVFRDASDNTIYNNVCCSNLFGIIVEGVTSNATLNNQVINNISVLSINQNLFIAAGGAERATIVDHNCFGPEGNASRFLSWNYYPKATVRDFELALGANTHSIAEDPQFVSPSSGSFLLLAASRCIDAGLDLGISIDMAGEKVPQGKAVDLGAIEHSAPPSPPRNVRVAGGR